MHRRNRSRIQTALSLFLAGIIALFLIEPSLPSRVHGLFTSKMENSRPPAVGTVREDRIDWNEIRRADESLVRSWAEKNAWVQPVRITPVQNQSTFTLNRFQLNDGKVVQVYTLLPQPGAGGSDVCY